MLFRLVLVALLSAATASVSAQPIRIGVVVDRTGPLASAAMDAVLSAFEMRVQSSGGVFGSPLEVVIRDGRSDPRRTAAEIERLITEDDVHAVVCCATMQTTRAASDVAASHDVLVLTLTPPPAEGLHWLYGLGPSERTELRAVVSHAYAEGKRALALMTLDNDFGDLPVRVLAEELGAAGMELAAVERYRPDATVLTPEALWVATRQPGAVVVWGLAPDTAVAVDALRRRGYVGPVYARSALLADARDHIDALFHAGVRFPVAPIQVDMASDGGHPTHTAAAALADFVLALYGSREIGPEAARAYDALELLRAAAEQAAVYGVSPDAVAAYRVAIRDAAIALPLFTGAGGTYDLEERSNHAAMPTGLVVVETRGDRLVPVLP